MMIILLEEVREQDVCVLYRVLRKSFFCRSGKSHVVSSMISTLISDAFYLGGAPKAQSGCIKFPNIAEKSCSSVIGSKGRRCF